MSTENLTHWKKNNDSKYISGEDLQAELHGLKKEMVVSIAKFEDAETFDQNNQAKVIKTGFWLKGQDGKLLYKPVLLNKTNAKFCASEFKSDFMEHWIDRPFTIYAKHDKRHGYVVRFKNYVLPVLIKDSANYKACYDAIHKNNYTIDQIKKKYNVSAELEKELLTKPTA